jgi:hypothetical protein
MFLGLASPDVAAPWVCAETECVWVRVCMFVYDPRAEETSESSPVPAPFKYLFLRSGVELLPSQKVIPKVSLVSTKQIELSAIPDTPVDGLMNITFL